MGELSYPVFLFHIPVAEALSPYIGLKPLTLTYYLTCLPAIFLCAYVLHVGVERPIGRLRDRIRGHGKLS
jgi:peptidoglycan/LPS O-acetylase OafA/YrhL